MKCLEDCGYNAKPDNLDILKAHVEICIKSGACRRLKNEPVVIWKDGGFSVVEKAKKNDRVFDVKFIKKVPIELTEELIKKPSEYVFEPNVTPGGIEDSRPKPKPKKTAKAKKTEEL